MTSYKPSYVVREHRPPAVTAGGIDARDEDRWWSELEDAMSEYLRLYILWREAPKAEEGPIAAEMHEAKLAIVERFYAQGWDRD